MARERCIQERNDRRSGAVIVVRKRSTKRTVVGAPYGVGVDIGVANDTDFEVAVDVRSTQASVLSFSRFESMRLCKAVHGLLFVMASAGLLSPLIHMISAISWRSKDCRRHMRSIMSRFSCVVPSLTRQSYKLFESVQMTSGRGSVRCRS
jgi:hypothetical protein